MECPRCQTENSPKEKKCVKCGLLLADARARLLSDAETATLEDPQSASARLDYAYALVENNKPGEARTAADKALPLFPHSSLNHYEFAAAIYASIGQAKYAERLLADGVLYNLEHCADDYSLDEVESVGDSLREVAAQAAIQEFNKLKPDERRNRREYHLMRWGVSFDQNPLPELDGLETYTLAARLANPEKKRLYPHSMQMTTQTAQKQIDRANTNQIVKWAVIVVIALVLLSFLMSRCGAAELAVVSPLF